MAREPLNKPIQRSEPLTILDTDYASLWCHVAEGIVHHRIKRWQEKHGEELQYLFQAGLDQMRIHGCTGWLSDDQNFGRMQPSTEAWAQTVWRPQMVEAGWKRWAIVLPERTISQLSLQRFAEEHRGVGIEVDVFGKSEDAFDWLCRS